MASLNTSERISEKKMAKMVHSFYTQFGEFLSWKELNCVKCFVCIYENDHGFYFSFY